MKRMSVLYISIIYLLISCVSSKPTYTKSISANGDVVLSNVAYRKKLNVPLAILTNIAIGAAASQVQLKDDKTGLNKKIGLRGGAIFGITSGILTYAIGSGYKQRTWKVTDNTWQSWWAKVNKKENFQTTYVEFNHSGSNISSVSFFSPANADRFRILTEKDVRTYNSFLKNKIDINTVIEKSYAQMDESAISAIVKEYPNNNYINQLRERYTNLVTIRKRAEQKEYESAAAAVNLFGGIAKDIVANVKDGLQNMDFSSSSTPSNTPSTNTTKNNSAKNCEWKLISKDNSNNSAEFRDSDKGMKKVLWKLKKEGIDGSKPHYLISGTSYLGTEVRYYYNDGGDVYDGGTKLGIVFSLDEAIILLLNRKYCK